MKSPFSKPPLAGLAIAAMITSCTNLPPLPAPVTTSIVIDMGRESVKTSGPPPDELVSDINLFIFNSVGGILEASYYIGGRTFSMAEGISVPLVVGASYDIFACINFGYKVQGIKSENDLLAYRFYLAYPDDYRLGFPMTAHLKNCIPEDGKAISLQAGRLMAKVSLSIDRSALSENVTMNVRRARLFGAPRSALPFRESRPLGREDTFAEGFSLTGAEADGLNRNVAPGRSAEVSLYMLESISGEIPRAVTDPSAAGIYPYIELEIAYNSPALYTKAGEWLLYRFCVGEEEGVADVRRNTHYRYCVKPEGNGLEEFSWRLDKSALAEYN